MKVFVIFLVFVFAVLIIPTNPVNGLPISESCTYKDPRIHLFPTKDEFALGEPIMIDVDSLHDDVLEVIVKNPNNVEVFADVIKTDSSGKATITIPSSNNQTKGTWNVFVHSQYNESQEVVFVGVGQKAVTHLVVNQYQLNYTHEKDSHAYFLVAGNPKQSASVAVFDSNGNNVLNNRVISIPSEGRCNYSLDLTGFDAGGYNLEISHHRDTTSAVFNVGIQPSVSLQSDLEKARQTKGIFQTGIIQWSSRCYSPSETAQVTVIDRDMNLDSNVPDQFQITVWSDWIVRETGKVKTLSITVIETGNSTGVFEGTVFLGSAFDEAYGGRIPVGNDNTIFAKYFDYTPSGHSDVMEIIETTTGKNLPFGSSWDIWKDNSLLFEIPLVYDPCVKKQMDIIGIDDIFEEINIAYPAPLKQIESGLYIDEVICKDSLVLIKKNNGYRYCVNPDTVPSLHERGWATNANLEGASSRMCYVEPDPGPCKAAIQKYYLDGETGTCKSFTWGGCNGKVPFDTLGLCQDLCGVNNEN